MQITEIPFKSFRSGKSFTNLASKLGMGWSAPIKLPEPIRIWKRLCEYIAISDYGAIHFLVQGDDGRTQYLYGDKSLPEDMSDTDGFILIPWGEPLRLRGCGTHIKMYQSGSVIVIDIEAKSSRIKYMYQVQFDLRKSNEIELHYYHCLSGYNTFVGLAEKPDNYIDWPLKESQPYHKKALRIDTLGVNGGDTHPDPDPAVTKKWATVYESSLKDGGYRVQELR